MNPYVAPVHDGEDGFPEVSETFRLCPRCSGRTELGFTAEIGQAFVALSKILRAIRFGERLASRPPGSWWGPPRYFFTHWCRDCGCYVVDAGRTVTLDDIRRLAEVATCRSQSSAMSATGK